MLQVSPVYSLSFHLSDKVFHRLQVVDILMKSNLTNLPFMDHDFVLQSENSLSSPRSRRLSLIFFFLL